MYVPTDEKFNGYFDTWCSEENVDERTMTIKYLKVINPTAPESKKRYERRSFVAKDYIGAFRAEAYAYFLSHFEGEKFDSIQTFLHAFSQDMMMLLCLWELEEMDRGEDEIRTKKIPEERIVNKEWVPDR